MRLKRLLKVSKSSVYKAFGPILASLISHTEEGLRVTSGKCCYLTLSRNIQIQFIVIYHYMHYMQKFRTIHLTIEKAQNTSGRSFQASERFTALEELFNKSPSTGSSRGRHK